MRIDFHTHCFPDKIAEKAMGKLSVASGGLIPQTDGTAEGLRREMKKDGVDISVVMNIATNAHQQHSVNDFAASLVSDDLIPFGSVHPDAPDALEELERIRSLGLKGVKFHPEYQQFYVDDEKMFPIYKKISDLGLITLFHAGGDIGFPPPYHGCHGLPGKQGLPGYLNQPISKSSPLTGWASLGPDLISSAGTPIRGSRSPARAHMR